MKIIDYLKKFWAFLKEDSWQSWVVSIILMVVIVKFVFFPGMTLITGSPLPLVVIESCSMYHNADFESWWSQNEEWYAQKDITKEDFESFSYKNGMNKGDIILVWARGNYNTGDVIIFEPNADALAPNPIIHRLIGENPYETKGDHNTQQLMKTNNLKKVDETNIPKENVLGKSLFKIPLLGWVKLIFYEAWYWGRLNLWGISPPHELGFCK
jgi:signal peptidase I